MGMFAKYDVVLERDGERIVLEDVESESHILAANNAEKSVLGSQAKKVRRQWEFLGRCEHCHALVVEGTQYHFRNGTLRCEDCP